MCKRLFIAMCMLFGVSLTMVEAQAREFRVIKPINAVAKIPEGAQPPQEFAPVP